MKHIYLFVLLSLFSSDLNAQWNKIAYQTIVRDASNNLIINQAVGIKMTIHQTTSSGNAVYIELHNPTTNANGLASIELGGGAIMQGFWRDIDWSKGPYFVQIQVDPAGGTNYTSSFTEQLLSVPYALNSKASESTFSHTLGEFFEGGIIFHLWKDSLGIEHGLIADKRNLDSVINFSNENISTPISLFDGKANCNIVQSNSSNAGSAVDVCLNSSNENKTDWYLPSINELSMLYRNVFYFNQNSTFNYPALGGELGFYYSSTVVSNSTSDVYGMDFTNGRIVKLTRQYSNGPAKYYVRAIRQF